MPQPAKSATLRVATAAPRARAIATADCQIAAIARACGAAVATRNVDDFAGCGVAVVDPWAGAVA